jgi:hypothetical protein
VAPAMVRRPKKRRARPRPATTPSLTARRPNELRWPVNTALSGEEWAELCNEIPSNEIAKDLFVDGLTPQPIDDATMHLR